MGEIKLWIEGVAVPALRPRVTRGGRHTYEPEKSANWKALVAAQILAQKPPTLEGPLTVRMIFRLPRPKSAPKTRQFPDRKPDLDNLVKGIMDAINQTGRVWRDDAQVVGLLAVKRYAKKGGQQAGVLIYVWPAEPMWLAELDEAHETLRRRPEGEE